MNRERWALIKSVFTAALEQGPAQREGFVADRCEGDDELAREVRRLLSMQAAGTLDRAEGGEDGPPADAPADGLAPLAGASPLLRASDHIGSYRILGVLGEGGMGIVYLAEQERPRRTVALKVIRSGIASPAMLKRFEHEAQMLGRLQHPGIAQIFEAGTANTGHGPQPYFAMEMVRGRPLVQYAREAGLGTRERMELMARVCDAVHHAHHKGVIHRDLKPGNILVDESGQPRVLDFGVARATDSDVQATTMRTDLGQLLGTVPYMSPEQAAGAVDDVDSRSDVYSLGVVLYELLTEQLPYDISGRMVHEAVRIIREEEPHRLSSVNTAFRGDIETIVGKALLKERARRYQSAADLAADIRRYLRSEPITARAPTAAYQISRFARQHRAHEAAEAMAITKFLQELLATSESIISSGKENTVRQILDMAAARLETGSRRDRPELEIELRTNLGRTYNALGVMDRAEQQLRAALQLAVRTLGPEHPTVPNIQVWLGAAVYMVGRPAEALDLLRRSLESRTRMLGPSHPDVADGLCALAEVLYAEGDAAAAEPLYREALAILGSGRADAPAPGSAAAGAEGGAALMGLGGCLLDLDRAEEAEPILHRCLGLQAASLPEGHWRRVATRGLAAACLARRGRHDEAEPLLLEVWADLKSNPAAPPMARRRAAEQIARLYESTGRRELAKVWRGRMG